MLRLLAADLRSNVSPLWPPPLFWPRVIGKALFSPAAHVVILYRLSTLLYANPLLRPLAFLLRSVAVVWGGTEIHPSARIGPGLCLVHSLNVVIGPGVQIGANARIGHGVTIGGDTGPVGVRSERTGIPVLGAGVTVAVNAIILGPVTVGDGAFIAAQSLVLHDVPARAVVRGSPAKVVRYVNDGPSDQKSLTSGEGGI